MTQHALGKDNAFPLFWLPLPCQFSLLLWASVGIPGRDHLVVPPHSSCLPCWVCLSGACCMWRSARCPVRLFLWSQPLPSLLHQVGWILLFQLLVFFFLTDPVGLITIPSLNDLSVRWQMSNMGEFSPLPSLSKHDFLQHFSSDQFAIIAGSAKLRKAVLGIPVQTHQERVVLSINNI